MPTWLWWSIDKQAAGNGKKIMEAVWSQFDENKFVIVCDGDVNVSDWNDIIWAGDHKNGSGQRFVVPTE